MNYNKGIKVVCAFCVVSCWCVLNGYAAQINQEQATENSASVFTKEQASVLKDQSEINIPDGCTKIESHAFAGFKNLKKVVLPASVKSVGEYAFSGCGNLEYINIENVEEIGRSAFADCRRLGSIHLSERLSILNEEVFSCCEKLSSINLNNITEIRSAAFGGCASLKEITIPDGVRELPDYAFVGCSELAKIVIPSSLVKISSNAFEGCENLKEICISCGAKMGTAVRLGDSIINLTQGVRNVECSNDGEISTDDPILRKYLKCCGVEAKFLNETEVVFPDGTTCIDGGLFDDLPKLRKITIPATVEVINNNAFIGCTGLKEIYLKYPAKYGTSGVSLVAKTPLGKEFNPGVKQVEVLEDGSMLTNSSSWEKRAKASGFNCISKSRRLSLKRSIFNKQG